MAPVTVVAPAAPEVLPEELLLRCLQPLPHMGTHMAVSAACRAFRETARDDRIWAERLARDFPLASRAKPPGSLHRIYRMLARSQLRCGYHRWVVDVEAPASTSTADVLEDPSMRSSKHQVEIRMLAARFAELNAGVTELVPVRSAPVVIAPPRVPPRVAPYPDRAALLEAIRARGAASG